MTTRTALIAATVLSCCLALTGCNGAFLGNVAVLGLTVGIFLGTLSLGRRASPPPTREGTSSSTSSRS